MSKALIPIEQYYPSTEWILLDCVHGAEYFQTSVFGHKFTAESDHIPLKKIPDKNLANTSIHLQSLLLHLQGYNVRIMYQLGKKMLLADTLSCCNP